MEETGASALRSIPRALWGTITLLGIGQICAWGTLYYSFAVTGPLIAREFGISLPSAVLGYSALLVAGAFAAPTVGRTIDRLGGRAVLAGGAVVGALGLTTIGLAPGPLVYAIGCLILGIAVAMSLYDAAFPALVQVAGPRSNRAITLLTLFGGLASTFFWPIAAAIAARWGWRATYLSFAAVNICVCLPISLIALPRRPPLHVATDGAPARGWSRPPLPLSPEARRAAFICFALMVAAGNFVFAGLAVHLLTILGALGLSESAAIIIGMIVGPAQVIGRIGEMSLGPRASPILAGRISAAMQPASIAVLIFAPVGIATGGNLRRALRHGERHPDDRQRHGVAVPVRQRRIWRNPRQAIGAEPRRPCRRTARLCLCIHRRRAHSDAHPFGRGQPQRDRWRWSWSHGSRVQANTPVGDVDVEMVDSGDI